MYNKKLLMLTTIFTISGASHLAIAANNVTDQIAKQPSAAISSHTENVAFEYSARKILGYASEARVALDNKQNDIATAYIDNAVNEMDKVRNTQNFLETVGIQFGRVYYGKNNSYYIPVADDSYAVRTYTKGPFWSANKTTAVRDVGVITVDISINPEKATEHLQEAKAKIEANDVTAASKELKNLLDESIRETTKVTEPLITSEDNIYLTRILIRQQNYDGARFTLKHAKAALKDYEATIKVPAHRAGINSLHKEIDNLDNTIKQKDPTLLQKSTDTVDKLWNDLKSWAKENKNNG